MGGARRDGRPSRPALRVRTGRRGHGLAGAAGTRRRWNPPALHRAAGRRGARGRRGGGERANLGFLRGAAQERVQPAATGGRRRRGDHDRGFRWRRGLRRGIRDRHLRLELGGEVVIAPAGRLAHLPEGARRREWCPFLERHKWKSRAESGIRAKARPQSAPWSLREREGRAFPRRTSAHDHVHQARALPRRVRRARRRWRGRARSPAGFRRGRRGPRGSRLRGVQEVRRPGRGLHQRPLHLGPGGRGDQEAVRGPGERTGGDGTKRSRRRAREERAKTRPRPETRPVVRVASHPTSPRFYHQKKVLFLFFAQRPRSAVRVSVCFSFFGSVFGLVFPTTTPETRARSRRREDGRRSRTRATQRGGFPETIRVTRARFSNRSPDPIRSEIFDPLFLSANN
jgi:hypothetical protein